MSAVRRIDQSVLAVLSGGRCDGAKFFLPGDQLERKLYQSTNDVLLALGGKWNRSAKAHVFGEPCEDIINDAIETGSYTRAADMGWFPTPPAIAHQVVDLARIDPGMAVLEPSAGTGSLAHEAMARGGLVECYEINAKRADTLRSVAGFEPLAVVTADFLSVGPEAKFDRVVMNPPFAKRADIHHVLHARKFLKPEGLLVSIMSGGIAFREDRLTTDFRTQCESIDPLPDGAFHESGTDVRTVVITMKPA